ncbi:DUF4263 domain-containing protein [Patescibacteria group bacterium]|nr:DUF4263 domain-containing protein [Patescibacteria group bacterium]MBU2159169.1 DUF4263 domain-containing protein [Patescibacteria group bacterium]
MGKPTKTIAQKLQTKLAKLREDGLIVTPRQVTIRRRVLFRYTPEKISYTRTRYFPSMKEDIVEEDFTAEILLDHQTLGILSGQLQNPPRGVSRVLDMIRYAEPDIDSITVGGTENKVEGSRVFVTHALYIILTSINREEGRDKVTRVRNRVAPFLKDNFDLETEELTTERDYGLLMNEILASKAFTQNDIAQLASELESGELNEIVIERQINKQAEWLLDSMQTIIDEPELTQAKSRELGQRLFNFSRASISGPEKLMEKILTKYGQNIIFGVPALLNVDGFVTSSAGLPRSQFDLLLINNLSDVEIVELKRPDEFLLDFDDSRNKFYASKDLGIATAQAERYISAIYRENDAELRIQGQSIREYLQSKLGGTITLSICRPKALIVMGRIQNIAKRYDDLSARVRASVTRASYEKNLDHAYKEIKSSYKNIDITTYSELIESARLRLQVEREDPDA